MEAYQKFETFDWSDERWELYLSDLFPTPTGGQLLKWKKKWYKKHVDSDFDIDFEPPRSDSAGTGDSDDGGSSYTPPPHMYSAPPKMLRGSKASICFASHSIALMLSVAAIAGAFSPLKALLVLLASMFLDILAKYGLRFQTSYLQAVLLDDVGAMPIMVLALLMPGIAALVRMFALIPPSLTVLLAFAQICRSHTALPSFVRNFFDPLAEVSARYQVMQTRADIEMALSFILIFAAFTGRAPPITVVLYWNFMMMRYMMNAFTQASYRKVDAVLNPVFGRIPIVRNGYAALKRFLFSFVDPQRRQQGSSMCNIL